MITLFNNDTEKLEFLKKYELVSPTKTSLPTFYYYAPSSDTPVTCEIAGYEQTFDTWAVIVINVSGTTIKIHSSCLLEMRARGASFYRKSSNKKGSDSVLPTYVVFDIETTGLSHFSDKIIEIAAIKYTGEHISEFHEYVYIDDIIPVNITLLTGISNETLQDAPTIDMVMPQFLSFIENHVLVGHNIKSFDIPFINKVCSDLGLPLIKNKVIDTLHLAKKELPNLGNYKQSTLCDYYDIDTSNAHHALFDCYMCDQVYRSLVSNDIRNNYISTSSNPFEDKILSILKQIIAEKELPEKGLRLRKNNGKNVNSYSVLISEPPYPIGSERLGGEQSVTKLSIKKGTYEIDILQSVLDEIPCPDSATIKQLAKNGNSPQHAVVTFLYDSPKLYNFIASVILYRLKHYRTAESTFSCCSKFMQCSDAKKCVHENKLYSTACTYRQNLENGRIFYGKNKNID